MFVYWLFCLPLWLDIWVYDTSTLFNVCSPFSYQRNVSNQIHFTLTFIILFCFYFTTANLLHWMIEKKDPIDLSLDSINGVCFVIEIYSCFTIFYCQVVYICASLFTSSYYKYGVELRWREHTKKTETIRKFNTSALLFHKTIQSLQEQILCCDSCCFIFSIGHWNLSLKWVRRNLQLMIPYSLFRQNSIDEEIWIFLCFNLIVFFAGLNIFNGGGFHKHFCQ